MENATAEMPGTVAIEPPSTVLNPETVKHTSGAGRPDLREQGNSVESVLEDELARLKDEDSKLEKDTREKGEKATDDAKAKAEAAKDAAKQDTDKDKPAKARADDGKFAKAEPQKAAEADKSAPEKAAAGQDGSERARQSEGRQYQEPPARFLPEERAKWANVPNELKGAYHRVIGEMEAEVTRTKQSAERYETFRQYDETAKSNGRDLSQVFDKVVRFEQAFQRNAPAAFDQLFREMGARKPDGSPLTFVEFATSVARQAQANPQAFQQPAQQSGPDPEVQQLKQEIYSMRAEQATQAVVPVVQQFASAHPDFNDLFPSIKAILESKVIEGIYGNGLSHEQKLAEAYRMAGGKGLPSSEGAQVAPEHSRPERDVPSKDAGTKSIRGAPSDGADTAVTEDNLPLEETLRRELRKFKGG